MVYVGGYAIKDNIAFSDDDGHAWSLIKVNGEWLPFDSTWGIFSGKLPLCHVFDILIIMVLIILVVIV